MWCRVPGLEKQTRLGMVLRAWEPNPIREPPIMISQLVPLGHLYHHHQNLGTPGLTGFACQLWQRQGPPKIGHQASSASSITIPKYIPLWPQPQFPREELREEGTKHPVHHKVAIPQRPWGLSMYWSLLLRTQVWTHLGPVTFAHMH